MPTRSTIESGRLASGSQRATGTRFVYEIVAPASDRDHTGLVLTALRSRFKHIPDGISLLSTEEGIVVEVKDERLMRTARIQQRIEEPFGTLTFGLVDEQSDFMKALSIYAAQDKKAKRLRINTETDSWNSENSGSVTVDSYLSAADGADGTGRERLEKYLVELSATSDQFKIDARHFIGYEVVVLREGGSKERNVRIWRTYYLVRNTALMGSILSSATISMNPTTGRHEILVRLNDPGKRFFADLTRRNIGKKLAILVGRRVALAPIIHSEIPNGSIIITMGSGSDKMTERNAQELTHAMRLGASSVSLRLKSISKL